MKKWIALCLGALLLVTALAGCGTGKNPSGSQDSSSQGETADSGEIITREDGSISFTDLSGRAITLEKQPETIAVANYLVNFMLVGGAQSLDKVSALAIDGWQDTRYGEYTVFTESFPKLLELPSVGGYHNDVLDAEKVLALAPDVLLINTSQYTESKSDRNDW